MTEYSAAKLRDLIDSGEEDLHKHSGHVSDPELSHAMSVACDLIPGFEDSALYETVAKSKGTQQATRAAESGNDALLGYLGGLTDDSITSSEVQGLMNLLARLRTSGYLATFFGRTNKGKTNLALLAAEIALHDDDKLVLVTNITSVQGELPPDRLQVVEDYPTLKRVVEQLKELGHRTIVVLDEFSSHGSGYTSDRQEVEEKMRLFVRKLAKTDTRCIIIGHDGSDVHPTMREFSDDIIFMHLIEPEGIVPLEAEADYRAEFYEAVSDREPVGHRFTLSRVPKASWNYNPDEYTSWSWTDGTEAVE